MIDAHAPKVEEERLALAVKEEDSGCSMTSILAVRASSEAGALVAGLYHGSIEFGCLVSAAVAG